MAARSGLSSQEDPGKAVRMKEAGFGNLMESLLVSFQEGGNTGKSLHDVLEKDRSLPIPFSEGCRTTRERPVEPDWIMYDPCRGVVC